MTRCSIINDFFVLNTFFSPCSSHEFIMNFLKGGIGMGFLFVCLKKNNHFVWHDILQNKRARKGRWEVRVFSVIVGEKHIEIQHHLESWTSKSRTKSLVSSVPFRDPTAQTSLVELARILQTTPPLPPLSKATKSRMNSPKNNNKQGVFINVKYSSLYLYIVLIKNL